MSTQHAWFTAKEAADYIGVTVNTLRRYTKLRKNRPPLYRLMKGGRLRFPREEFIQWANGSQEKRTA